MSTSQERRHYSRFPAQHLQVMVKSFRAVECDWEPGQISSVDFNRYGIALETNQNFVVGDILRIVIRTDDNTVAEVNGLVCNRTQTEFGFRFGIRFEHDGCEDEDAPDAMLNISEEILMIEKEAAAQLH